MKSTLNILLVEDQADDRDLICHLLRRGMDNTEITCEDDRQAVMELMRKKIFDLIITDYKLDGYTGIELIDEIRSLKGFDTPIVVITGEDSEEISLQALNHGVDDFIIKTLKGLRELPAVIQRTLKRAEIHKIKHASDNLDVDTDNVFHNIFENASELIFTLWPDGTFVNANDATLNALGILRKDLSVKNLVEYIDNPNRGTFKAALNRILNDRTTFPIDLTLVSTSGERINITGNGHPNIVNERVVASNWIFRNETSNKYVESLIWDDYKQYSGIFDLIPTAIFISDHRGKILQVNNTGSKLIGYDKDELPGLHIRDISHPDDEKTTMELHRKLMSGEIPDYIIEKRYKHKSGNYLWVEVSGSTIKNQAGEPMYGIAHVKDITDVKHFEELLGKLAQDLIKVKGQYIFERLPARLIELLISDYVFISQATGTGYQTQDFKTVILRDKEGDVENHEFVFPYELLNELTSMNELIITNRITKKGKLITQFDHVSATDVVAIPLRDDHANLIGILGTIYNQPTRNHSMISALLRIAGLKITEQLQNLHAENSDENRDNDSLGNYSIN